LTLDQLRQEHHKFIDIICDIIHSRLSRLNDWGLTALSTQYGYIVPCTHKVKLLTKYLILKLAMQTNKKHFGPP